MRKSEKPRGTLLAWVLSNAAHRGDDCLMWPFSKTGRGYGRLRINGKTRPAHRVMLECVVGPSPFDKPLALHSCGNGHLGCCNPRHMYWGDLSDNVRDSIRHGTHRPRRGENQHLAKLTERDVVEIRSRNPFPGAERAWASEFGVSKSAIGSVIRRKNWAHVA